MLLFNNLRESVILAFSFLLWSWTGAVIAFAFALMFALNILEAWLSTKIRAWLKRFIN